MGTLNGSLREAISRSEIEASQSEAKKNSLILDKTVRTDTDRGQLLLFGDLNIKGHKSNWIGKSIDLMD